MTLPAAFLMTLVATLVAAMLGIWVGVRLERRGQIIAKDIERKARWNPEDPNCNKPSSFKPGRMP